MASRVLSVQGDTNGGYPIDKAADACSDRYEGRNQSQSSGSSEESGNGTANGMHGRAREKRRPAPEPESNSRPYLHTAKITDEAKPTGMATVTAKPKTMD